MTPLQLRRSQRAYRAESRAHVPCEDAKPPLPIPQQPTYRRICGAAAGGTGEGASASAAIAAGGGVALARTPGSPEQTVTPERYSGAKRCAWCGRVAARDGSYTEQRADWIPGETTGICGPCSEVLVGEAEQRAALRVALLMGAA